MTKDSEIYNSNCCLFVEEKTSDKLLVIFSGVNATSFTGYKLFSPYKTNKLFIRDPNKSWYNGPIENLSSDANDLLIKIKYITDMFKSENITMFGSSMGGYAAILFGLKLNIGNIVTFGPQIILNSKMPNNPLSMKYIIYDNLYDILDNNSKTKIDIYFGSEEVLDVYNLANMKKYKNVFLHCLYGSQHDVMSYLNKLGLMSKLLDSHILDNTNFQHLLPQYNIFSNDKLLEYTTKGISLFYQEKYNKALFAFTELVICEPSWSAGWAFLGKTQLNLNLLDDALLSLNKSFEIFYNTEHPHFDAGMVYFKKQEYEKAEIEFKNALKFANIPKNDNILKLAISLREQGKIQESMQYLKMIKQRNSENFGFLFQAGRLNLLKGNYRTAKEYFKRSLKRNPKSETANNFYQAATKYFNNSSSNLPKYKLFASGDCILARRMHYFYEKYGTNWILGDIPSITKKCDIVMTNLETVITNQGHIASKGDKKPYVYRASPNLVEILLDLNINIVTTANNHSVDYGKSGIVQQNKILNQLGIATPGSGMNYNEAKAPQYIQVGDTILAFVSIFSFWQSDKYCATDENAGVFHITDENQIIQELTQIYQEANCYADLVILSPHWNENWTSVPKANIQQLAKHIIDIGYDAIIGHSSHILHGMELYKNKPIIYDMGTFLVDNTSGHKDLDNSACFVLTFDKTGFDKVEIYPTVLKNGRTSLASAEIELDRLKDKFINLSRKISDDIFFGDIDNKLVVEFYNNSKNILKDTTPPSKLYHTINTKQTLSSLNIEQPNILLKTLPKWAEKKQINSIFSDSFKLIATKIPKAFLKGTSFLIENLLEAYGPLSSDRWEIVIVGKHIDLLDSFEDLHPLSNGIYNPIHWKKGDLIIDQAVVRVKSNLVIGTYEIYFGFYNVNKNIYLKINQSHEETNSDHLAYVGNIDVLSSGIPNMVSGVDWGSDTLN